ncbi:SMP-30/gluconolactonase/LRE family protein [Shewanella psychrotolerans]|uniref:SMP-30/gluconolactonase/LRE family protein n=1 Tax=Shewanella psychrotolerans TaxID=2864206 RepID=UPI001C65C7D0|nr:SMP-30/gluconolactonase/LRE family protein [Shewanella psychrotolerans]QYK03054.1 SMP-30/gluconolactonase/LRE family protein [Shewanella psychrotolerans]
MTSVTIGSLITTVKAGNTLGEGVFWDQQTQSIWWTDIEDASIFQYMIDTKQLKAYSMPYRVGCFALIKDDPRLIVAFDRGIALYDLNSAEIEWLAEPEEHLPCNRFNDGRVDRQGRFWAGTMVDEHSRHVMSAFDSEPSIATLGALYCVDHYARCQKMLTGIGTANSLCWSPDSQYMYHADSTKQQITRFDFDSEAVALKTPCCFATTEGHVFPDGSEVDADGYLWNAQWGGGKIVRYTPDGDIDISLSLPVSNPTSVAFGGKNLDWLIITSAKHGLSDQQLTLEPQAGDLFIYQLHGINGLAANRYLSKSRL